VRAPLLLSLTLLLAGCAPGHRLASWRIYPLPRHQAHDGLAVVSQPDGYGLHIWLDTDTSRPGECRPRWNPDAARLFNGNGSAPFSSGLASRAEFFEAMGRGGVRWALRRQMRDLCQGRAPNRQFRWSEPPRSAAAFRPEPLPPLEEEHLLSHPTAIRRAEKRLLGQPLTPEDMNDKPTPRPPSGP
jgi:hypothetical protein